MAALTNDSVPPLKLYVPPLPTFKLVAPTAAPAWFSVPAFTVRFPSPLTLPLTIQLPVPTFVNVPAPPASVPVKLVVAPPNPTCSALPARFTRPPPLSASSVPLLWKFTVPPLFTVTALRLVMATGLAQLNAPPPLTVRLLLAVSFPFTVNVPALTTVTPV